MASNGSRGVPRASSIPPLALFRISLSRRRERFRATSRQSAEGDEDAFLLLTPNGCFLCADIDMDGAIDFLDITPFVNLLDEVAAAVPEPATGMLLLTMALVTARWRTSTC